MRIYKLYLLTYYLLYYGITQLCSTPPHCRCAAVEPCPAPYDVDYHVAESLSIQLNLLDSKDNLIGDASDALKGSLRRGLQAPDGYSQFTVELLLDNSFKICGHWEITAFSLTVVGIENFVVTIGNLSSRVIQVYNIAIQYRQER